MATRKDLVEDPEVFIDDESVGPVFSIMEGGTYFERKNEWVLFGDFYMKIIGEIADGGYLVCSFGARVLGKLVERIVIPASAFDSKAKFLEKTRKSFGGGTFMLSEGVMLEKYYMYLKQEYQGDNIRQYFAADCIGLQQKKNVEPDYWCLSKEMHVYRKKVLEKERQRYLFLDDICTPFEVVCSRRLIGNQSHLNDVCKRFIWACNGFSANTLSMKLASSFVLSRLLRIHDEESWNESSIGMLHSNLDERNVGKSLTLDILAKAQGVGDRSHPTMLAGGDQSQSGVSVPVIRDTLSKTNLVVMIDDPVISANLAELFIQLQSGLTMGSRTGGVTKPGGSLMLTSNDDVLPRAEGRVLVFKYVRTPFSCEDEQGLNKGVKAIALENTGFLLAWAIVYKEAWEKLITVYHDSIKEILSSLLPEMQPRWTKGMSTVILTQAIFHASVGVAPMSLNTIREVVQQNKTFKKEHVMDRLQQSLSSKLEEDNIKVLFWLNPVVNVSCKGKFVPAIGIRSTAIEDFAQVSIKEVSNYLKHATDNKSSISMMYAKDETCTIKDIKQRKPEKAKMAKGFKVPMSCLEPELVRRIKVCCGVEDKEDDCSPETSKEEAEVPHESLLNVDRFSDNLKQIDKHLLDYFQAKAKASDREVSESQSSQELCPSCGKESPYQKRKWSRKWIQCDHCLKWYHQECSKLTRLPKKEDPWLCPGCSTKKK
ncbi:uncharacterized protein [Montipora foliosa]|uniref:uncharacterized protein n=1 Tax=Montipora foliosa TaxID=591990 RepID=UPI0035F19754